MSFNKLNTVIKGKWLWYTWNNTVVETAPLPNGSWSHDSILTLPQDAWMLETCSSFLSVKTLAVKVGALFKKHKQQMALFYFYFILFLYWCAGNFCFYLLAHFLPIINHVMYNCWLCPRSTMWMIHFGRHYLLLSLNMNTEIQAEEYADPDWNECFQCHVFFTSQTVPSLIWHQLTPTSPRQLNLSLCGRCAEQNGSGHSPARAHLQIKRTGSHSPLG